MSCVITELLLLGLPGFDSVDRSINSCENDGKPSNINDKVTTLSFTRHAIAA